MAVLPARPLLLAAGLLLSLGSLGQALAQTRSITAESIWDKSNAIERAQQQLPANATVIDSKCTVVNVRTGNYRYICTLTYTLTPPNGSSAPAP
jgi:hypothetical protein